MLEEYTYNEGVYVDIELAVIYPLQLPVCIQRTCFSFILSYIVSAQDSFNLSDQALHFNLTIDWKQKLK